MTKNTTHSRRNILKGIAAGSALGILGACSISTKDGVTTIELNVTEVVDDTNVALTIAQTALGFTGVPAAVVTAVDAGVVVIQNGLTAFKSSAGSTLTLTFNSTSVPAAFTSLIDDLKTVSANISSVASKESSSIDTTLMTKISSVSSDISNIATILNSIVSAVASSRLLATPTSEYVSRQLKIDAIKARHGLS